MTSQITIISEFETALVVGSDVTIAQHIEEDRARNALVVLSAADARAMAEAILNALPAPDDEDALINAPRVGVLKS